MKQSKFILMASLLVATTSVFAEDYFLINGKKISQLETKKSMISKLGKPEGNQSDSTTWTIGNTNITANFTAGRIMYLSMYGNTKGKIFSAVVQGKTITIGKDSPNMVRSKLKPTCVHYAGSTPQATTYNVAFMTTDVDVNYINFTIFGDGTYSDKVLAAKPIDSISWGDDIDTQTCKS